MACSTSSAMGPRHGYNCYNDVVGCTDWGHGSGWLNMIRHSSMSVDSQSMKVHDGNNNSVERTIGLSHSCSMQAMDHSNGVVLGWKKAIGNLCRLIW